MQFPLPTLGTTCPQDLRLIFAAAFRMSSSVYSLMSFNHLIKDCDFHDKKMVEKPVLNNKGRVTGQREMRPIWNNAQRGNSTIYFIRGFKRIFDSGCSRHMTRNKSFLIDYQEIDGGFVAFGGSLKGGKITGKGGLTCLFAKATIDESNLWYRRLGHINFKTMNKLVRGNLVRGLPSKLFENDHTCVACQKGKAITKPFGIKLIRNAHGYNNQAKISKYDSTTLYFMSVQRAQSDVVGDDALQPKKVTQALTDSSWIEAMQDELLQFSLQKFPVDSMGRSPFFLGFAGSCPETMMELSAAQDMPDIMFTVCACARFQVTPKFLDLHAVKRDHLFFFPDLTSMDFFILKMCLARLMINIDLEMYMAIECYSSEVFQLRGRNIYDHVAVKNGWKDMLVMRLSIRSWVIEWKGLQLLPPYSLRSSDRKVATSWNPIHGQHLNRDLSLRDYSASALWATCYISVVLRVHTLRSGQDSMKLIELMEHCTDKLKNHKKAIKNKQARTREPEEYKAEARKAKPQSKSAKKNQSHVINGESTRDVGFCAKSLTKEAQCLPKENDMLAIFRCPQINPTATIEAQMIKEMIG
ncbi:ribonuclease H-like domain-containing protein [Tanacetum coccineum]|uniref:Ribonuclease H-like domain-containing protein n=1 Tax=Tanacetum coccineum TaxID=301880 RepID=A0ABQ4YWF5_9ASTR